MGGRVLPMLLGILLIVGGVIMVATPLDTYAIVPVVMGIVMVLAAIACLAAWRAIRKLGGHNAFLFWSALLSAALGIALLVSESMQQGMGKAIIYISAAWMLIIGIIRIVAAVKKHNLKGYSQKMRPRTTEAEITKYALGKLAETWVTSLVIGILWVLCGVLCFVKPAIAMAVIGILIGIEVVMSGVGLIQTGFFMDLF